MDLPPPTITREDMLFKDLITAGVREALLECKGTVTQPNLDEVVQKHSHDLAALAKDSLTELTNSMSQSAAKEMEEYQKKISKKAKALLKTATEGFDSSVQHYVDKICEGLFSRLSDKISELIVHATSDINAKATFKVEEASQKMNEMAANKLQEASEHLQSMGRVLLAELKEDLQKFIDCKLKQTEKSVKTMTGEELYLAEDMFIDDDNLLVKKVTTNEQSGSDSETSFISFAGNNKDNAKKVNNLQEVKAKLMARQQADNPIEAGPSGVTKKKKLTLSMNERPPASVIIESSSEEDVDDPPAAVPAVPKKQNKVSSPKLAEQLEAEENNKCPICLGQIVLKLTLECARTHSFCKVCIEEWLKMRSSCPLCNTDVDLCEVPL